MDVNQTGNDIKQGFNAMAGGVKEAGRRRTADVVAKQGYVAFKNPDAVAQFRADPFYNGWNCTFVDGEYRFSPPQQDLNFTSPQDHDNMSNHNEVQETHGVEIEKAVNSKVVSSLDTLQEQSLEELQLLEVYKQTIADPTRTTFVSVSTLQDDPSKCKYELISIDKRTGERSIVQQALVIFEGKFSMEVLPSIYNQLSDGFPAIDYEKERGITFQNVDNSKVISFGNLSKVQLQLIKSMKEYVDNIYINQQQETGGFHR